MEKHVIELDKFNEWLDEVQEVKYASHVGNGYNKRLVATTDLQYKVYSHGNIMYHGSDSHIAVETYNNI